MLNFIKNNEHKITGFKGIRLQNCKFIQRHK